MGNIILIKEKKPHHIARKRFGQHFLHDARVIQQLVESIAPERDDHLVEIGPGQGALTLPLLEKVNVLDAVEFDRDLIPLLKKNSGMYSNHLLIHQADALEFNFNQLIKNNQPLRIIGNLPYNISTPLLFHLIESINNIKNIKDMIFMLQKEVVERLAAKPSTKAYGRLSIMMQYHCEVAMLFSVPPTAFTPPPKVESAVVRLQPHQIISPSAKNYVHFAELVKTAFCYRRKILGNSLKSFILKDQWENLAKNVFINPQSRPEQLSVKNYVDLSNTLQE